MNWLFWVVVVFMGYHVIDGYRKGFIRKAVSALSVILTLVLVTWLTPQITHFLQDKTPVYENMQEKCIEIFFDEDYDQNVKTEQVQMIENMQLPENIKEMLIENNNTEAYLSLGVERFKDYVGAYLATMILNAMAYLITFIVVWVVLKAALIALDVITLLPILHGVNRLAGAVLGLCFGVVLVWIAFLLVTVLCNGSLGQQFFEMIKANDFLLFLYNQNVIMKTVLGLIF